MNHIIRKLIVASLVLGFAVAIMALILRSSYERSCAAENGFLFKTPSGVECVPYRNDMQEFQGYDKLPQ